MLGREEIVALDRAHVWHPYTPMDAWTRADPIVVARAEGARLFDHDGRSYLDANASWWTCALGHNHPRLLGALREQSERFAHVALAGIAHEPAAALARDLCAVAPPGLTRVFYTDNGSTAIEAAIKMCVQAWAQLGAPKKTRFLAFEDAFHGESVGATSLGGVSVFRRPFAGILFDCVRGSLDDKFAQACEAIERAKDKLAAVVIEPMIQGAGGMRIHEPARLRELRAACDRAGVWLVLDEVFTGYGRTGPMWASEHAGIAPDLLCLGKSFCPILPMAAVLASEPIFRAFSGERERAFLYGHTFCGNPLGAAVAREVLAIYRDEQILAGAARKSRAIARAFAELGGRSLGMVGAVDLAPPDDSRAWESGYLGSAGWRVHDLARARGVLLRPLGETVYVAPALNIPDADLDELLGVVRETVTMAR